MEDTKILFQIRYDNTEDQFDYTTNQMTYLEFRAFVCFLRSCLKYFEKELELESETED